MRHADGDLVHALPGRHLDHGVQRGNGDLTAFQAEALGADIALLAERLEALGLDQFSQDLGLAGGVEHPLPGRALDLALDPGFLVGVLDVHELDRDGAAIGLAQDRHDLAQRGSFEAQHVVDEDRPVHVGFGEAVALQIEFRVVLRRLQAKRIEFRFQMAAHAVDPDQHQRPDRVQDRRPGLRQARLCTGRRDAWLSGLLRRRLAILEGDLPWRPGRALGIQQHRACLVVQRFEQFGKTGVHGTRGRHPSRIQIRQECRIGATEGTGQNIDACHGIGSFARCRGHALRSPDAGAT